MLIDKTGVRTHIPVGSSAPIENVNSSSTIIACIMLEPGTRSDMDGLRLVSFLPQDNENKSI